MTKQQLQLKCPKCRSSRLRKRGFGLAWDKRRGTGKRVQRYECKNPNCGCITIKPVRVN